jgi:hypothetical protein
MRLRNAQIACLTFAVALVAGCHAKRSVDTRQQQSALTPLAQEIEHRGYQVKASFIVPPTAWEVSTFRMRSKRSFSFRAEQPLVGTRDYFVRFWLFEETYDAIDDARNRLANLHAPDEAAVDEYQLTMRTGFRVGTVTYFLQTDAAIFWPEVRRFANELVNATPGAELTRYNQRTAEQIVGPEPPPASFSSN